MEKDASLLLEESELGGRKPTGLSRYLLFGLGVVWSLFQLWATELGTLDPLRLRAVHLAFALALAFLAYPGRRGPRERVPLLDWALALLGVAGALYVVVDYYGITQIRGGIPSGRDVFFGSLTLLVLFLAAWRAVGPALPLIASAFILYALTGPKGLIPLLLPPWLQLHAGSQWGQLMGQLYTTAEGIWGVPLGVSATFVFLFVLFGALLEKAGAGHFFIQVAYALLGHFRGGPAKAAVVASALTGVVSGSSVSNVVTTGTFTIPLMKRVGYPPEKAGAVEVASSSNGQLMPPVMGAAAFIMAEFLGIPYSDLILIALIPALLAYATLFITVHLEALQLGLKGVPRAELPPLGPILRSGAHYLLPLAYLLYALVGLRLTPERAALNTVFFMAALILVQEAWRAWRGGAGLTFGLLRGVRLLLEGLEAGARGMVGIALATATAGVIVGIVTMTGIGFGLTDIVERLSGGNLVLVLLLAQLTSLLLGMGLPTTANYIVMASLVVPVVLSLSEKAGYPVPPVAAHMFVFYFGIMADSTPPVALAAYAASAIAKSDFWKTAVQGFVYELRTALLAYMFFFSPKLLLLGVESLGEGVWIFLSALLGMTAFSASLVGFLHKRTTWPERALLMAAALTLVVPGLVTDALGLGLFLLVYALQRVRK
ncbi:MAG: TRAP transporter permease [Thermus sp.]|uniref:TRAP transporter permease n=1 Tax=Thermus sp. TaxID=275 RepID=UPI0025E41959|nr:TRAP transporter permease [Thermus sp.]MCS6867358.1 TRAP transporter permease [Thermus sp.]MCS7218102.1 TRAP transporter permease [Thermus sp.]MCX7849866.1 TRAP transporter permease [Thermus sp.]MDW8017960.1 TRAP transporter permease [Thermus sp.]MDW8357690.1 TRAP transporter permease [Thermus sp.]